jgi:hypothetical protein
MDLIGSNSEPPSVFATNADGTIFDAVIVVSPLVLTPFIVPTNLNCDVAMLFAADPFVIT